MIAIVDDNDTILSFNKAFSPIISGVKSLKDLAKGIECKIAKCGDTRASFIRDMRELKRLEKIINEEDQKIEKILSSTIPEQVVRIMLDSDEPIAYETKIATIAIIEICDFEDFNEFNKIIVYIDKDIAITPKIMKLKTLENKIIISSGMIGDHSAKNIVDLSLNLINNFQNRNPYRWTIQIRFD